MPKRAVTLLVLLLILFSLVTLTFNVKFLEVEGETDYQPNSMSSQWVSADYQSKWLGGASDDVAYSIVQTNDYLYCAVAGYTKSYGAGDRDAWLVKTGITQLIPPKWNKTYGGAGDDLAYSVVQTSDGGFALAGYTTSYGAGDGDAWLVKTDSNGTAMWNKTYGGVDQDYVRCLIQTWDGEYVLVGSTRSYGAGNQDFWLIKTDSSGNALWNKTYGGTGNDAANFILLDYDNGYILAGETRSYGAGGADAWLVKTDSNGTAMWNKTYGGTGFDTAYSLDVWPYYPGALAFAGVTNSSGTGNKDMWLVKTDHSGNTLWNKTYGGTNDDLAYSLVGTSDRGFCLAGSTASYGAGATDFWLVKTDASGTVQWNRTFGGTYGEEAYSLIQPWNGGFALAGYTGRQPVRGLDFWLVEIVPKPSIVISPDGSIDPSTAPIQRNGDTFTLTDNIYTGSNGILIERNSTTLDGAGYKLQTWNGGSHYGVHFNYNNINITIKNIEINTYNCGIDCTSVSNISIIGSTIVNTLVGIKFPWGSSNNRIIGNTIANNLRGIQLNGSSTNNIRENSIRSNHYYGMWLYSSSNNSIWHNNFENNTVQVYLGANTTNMWDNGYPSGGNYWSDYLNKTDVFRDVYQNITGSDAIADNPFMLGVNNRDNYPLMGLFGSPTAKGTNVTVFPTAEVGLTFKNVTTAGSTTINETGTGPSIPPAYNLVGQYCDLKTTAAYTGMITLRFIYNDTGMSQLVEQNLRLKHWNATSSSWEDVTTLVDTANNVIYGETDHLSIFTTHSINTITDPSIAFLGAASSKSVVGRGYSLVINVTVRNDAITPKTFNLNIFADANAIGTQTVTSLAPGEQRKITFIWQVPVDFPKANYTLIVGNLASWGIVAMAGDVCGIGTFPNTLPDGKVEIKDLAVMAKIYGVNYPDPRYVANYDIDGNGKIEIKDFAAAAKNYGKIDP